MLFIQTTPALLMHVPPPQQECQSKVKSEMSFNPLCHVTINNNIVVNKLKLERNTKSSILKAMERAHKTSYVTVVSFLWLRPFIGHKDAQ